jgi:hypothetical protein
MDREQGSDGAAELAAGGSASEAETTVVLAT